VFAQESTPETSPTSASEPPAAVTPEPAATSAPETSPTPAPEAAPVSETTPASEVAPAAEATPALPAEAAPEPAAVPMPVSPEQPVLLPEGTTPPDPAARDATFKEAGEQPPSEANPPPPAQGAPPVGGEDVIPLPEGTAIPPDANQMPSEPSTGSDEQLALPDDIPAPIQMPAGAAQAGPSAREIQVKYVETRTKAEKDEKVVNLKQQAERAKTDEDKRQALRAYYRLLFQKIRKLDASLTGKADTMEAAYLRRLEQNRIEPTIPLNPPPTPEPLP